MTFIAYSNAKAGYLTLYYKKIYRTLAWNNEECMKKALIFGIDGFVGKYMANELKENGYDVYTSSRNGRGEAYDGWYSCDLNDSEQVKNVIAEVNPSHIINLAGQTNVGISWRIPKLTVETNVCGAINIMEAVHQYNMECNILMVGSSEEYFGKEGALIESDVLNPSNPYGISKMMLEHFCELYREQYGMKVFFVRSFNHTGVGQNDNFVIPSWCKQVAYITKCRKSGIMKVGNLDIIRDFSNVKDIVNAYRLVIESADDSIIYNIGSGVGISLKEILNHVISLSDQQISIQQDPRLIRPIETTYSCANISLISNNLNWTPRYNIFDTVEEIYSYYYDKTVTK